MKNKPVYDLTLSLVLLLSIIYFMSGKALFIYIGLAIGVLSLASDTINYYITTILKKILGIVGAINAHVILSLVFFIVLLPTALLFRVFNKDPLNLRKGNTSFLHKDKLYESSDFDNPW